MIVYYHGGGWVLGSIEDSDLVARHLAQRTGCAVVLVGYRLAPGIPLPDRRSRTAWTALCWADEHLADLAGARVPLIVAGDSAGGNLAAVVARRAAHAGGPQIALQVLIYPVTDCDPSTLSYTDPANQLLLTARVDGVVLGSLRPGGWPRARTPTPRRCARRSCWPAAGGRDHR